MRVSFHPDFPKDINQFTARYRQVSDRLAARFRVEIETAIARVKDDPGSAGHFLNTGSEIVREVRRGNLNSFPFFVLYAVENDRLFFGSLIPSRSDPLTWLKRFR